MKRYFLTAALAITGLMTVQAQDANDTFIKIENHNIFSHCFKICDTNNDGIVTYAEAAAATKLGMDIGGRSNVIENYDFLQYFPNIEMFSVGNTPLEVVDLHMLKKLKLVNVSSALWLKKIIVGCEVAPEITGEDPARESIKVEFWVEDPVARQLFQEGYQYVEPVKQDGETFYIVSKNDVGGPYGLWHKGKLEVPCEYSIDMIKENYFTVEIKPIGEGDGDHTNHVGCKCQNHDKFGEMPVPAGQNNVITFKDDGIRDFCIDWLKTVDTNKDKQVTVEEAAAVKELSLMCFKSFVRNIKTYEDLQYFYNLEYLHAGFTYAETVDVSCCPKLKELDLSECRMLKTIVLAKGCKPQIKYPVAYKGEQAKIVYKK